jgi:hydroxypyruvate isomerase
MLFEDPIAGVSIERVLVSLRTIRVSRIGQLEFALHDAVCASLAAQHIQFEKEYAFAGGCRADAWVDGIVIEVKKQRPARAILMDQLTRYAEQDAVRGIVVVLERSIVLPGTIEGKPVHVLSLNSLWGIAL